MIDARRHFADAVNAQVIDQDDEARTEAGPSITSEIAARAARPRTRLPRVPAKPPAHTQKATADTESWLAALDEENE